MAVSPINVTPAVVFRGPGQVGLETVELPPMQPSDVLIETDISWISPGTELSYLRGERRSGDTPADTNDCPYPIVPGYQKVGRVLEVGSEVARYQPGQTVFTTLSRVSGMFDPFGGHVKFSVAPADQVYQLPEHPDPGVFSGAVLTQVGWNCGQRPALEPGDEAWVLGDGLVGLWTAQTLQSRGAKVRLIGRRDDRLAKFMPRPGDRVEVLDHSASLKQLPRDGDVRVFVDTVGSVEAVETGVDLLCHEGHLVCAGFYPDRDALSIRALRAKEITLHTPAGWTSRRITQTLDAIATGTLDTASLITHRLPVGSAPDAYRMLETRSDGALGVLLQW